MPGFKESNWTDQEVGFAVGRGVLIIPIFKGLIPYGFISKYQGLNAEGKSVTDVAKSIFLACLFLCLSRLVFADSDGLGNCMTKEESETYISNVFEYERINGLFSGKKFEGKLASCAVNGSVHAMYELGQWLYFRATVVAGLAESSKSLDEEKKTQLKNKSVDITNDAISYLVEAGNRGHALSIYKLGDIYNEGRTLSRRKVMAGKYYVLAGLLAYQNNLTGLGQKSYEKALEVTPEHPDLPKLKALVYAD